MTALAHLSDDAVLALLARSDDSALGELYDRYGGPAYRLALRILRDATLAQDAVQDAFLTAWRTAPSFDPRRGGVSSWLMTLVHRRAVDVVRREDRRRALPLDDAPVAAGDATDETAETRELRRSVQAALEKVTPLEREALALAYYGGLSQSEIAEKLGVPLGTVKSRMFAGLARLRDVLGEAG
ncbi:MAG TPA: sigma-70 family RNA polymerase sigma factor [Gaiellaceae bacterium]|nr:sigma-70 family RNA polymerase sigma factor [Gaiellaceae bacterium]